MRTLFSAARRAGAACLLGAVFCLFGTALSSDSGPVPRERPADKLPRADAASPVRKATGIDTRVPWTGSRVHGTPEPPSPWQPEVAFPGLRFFEPLAMAVVPGTGRFAVAERPGKIFTFENDRQTSRKDLLLDLERTVYGLAFHPDFEQNGYFYVTSLVDTPTPEVNGSRVSRFKAGRNHPPRAAMDSELVVIEWRAGGHNGGCLQFGPDGYLYLATGDGSGIADELQTGQDVSDLLGSILRIDVDRADEGRGYAVPADNPFVDRPGARPEVWAYGLRQAWKFSFDREGRLWAGEVGQDLWEMICLIEKGGNYGWSVMEGNHPFRPERPRGPTPILPPLVEHPHSDFRSVTGGHVYYGERLPELNGAYVYGDYDTGKVWSLRYDGAQVTDHRELCDTQIRIVAFGQDDAGEIYFLDFAGGQVHRLAPAPPPGPDAPEFPRTLSGTGLFASTREHVPAPGVIPYTVNAPLWSDGAEKLRLLAVPGESRIEFDAVTYPQPAPGASPGWRFPDGTVLVKTFTLEMEAGNPASGRRLETRLLHHVRMPGNDDEYGAQVWRGYTYVWNDAQTDADLLDADGLDRTYTVTDPQAPGGRREQIWRFPSRAECALCHTMSARYALGVNTLQFNRDHVYDTPQGSVIANQLSTLEHLGMFTTRLPAPPDALERLADVTDPHAALDQRARAYLHANCSHCHRKWGGGNAEFQLLAPLPLSETGTVNVPPGRGTFDLPDARLLMPGAPERSLLLHRMRITGLGRMPHVASNLVDEPAVQLIEDWIRQLPPNPVVRHNCRFR